MPPLQQHAAPNPASVPLPAPLRRSPPQSLDHPVTRRGLADAAMASQPPVIAAPSDGARLDFMTIWRVPAPLAMVWDEILHAERWPTWWRGVEDVAEVRRGSADGVGAVRCCTWRGALPHRVRFEIRTTRVTPLVLIEGAISGQVEGTWRWRFAADRTATLARCDWRLRAASGWLRRLAPAARLLFDWQHETVMRWGADGLARRLEVVRRRESAVSVRRAAG